MIRVTWTDVAPRDGLQNIAETVPTEAKIRLLRGLLDAGAPRVEATAFVSPQWVPQLADASDVLRSVPDIDLDRIRVLIPNLRGLELALDHRVRNVLVTLGVTDSFNLRNVNRSVAESLDELDRIVALAGTDCQVDVALSVCFGCPFEGYVEPARVIGLCRELLRRGVAEIGLSDTIGVAAPSAVRELCTLALEVVPPQQVSLHVHDTRGLGIVNVTTAYDCGITRYDGSVGGVGGCPFAPRSTGNVCSEDALQALISLGARVDTDLQALCGVAETLSRDLGRELPGKLYRAGAWTGSRAVAQEVEIG
jgi:hydroxymethylglutaryl-CoA lyase